MQRIRISKEFTFDMAHALHEYDGLCKNVHGHTYKLRVTLIGEPQVADGPKKGMVMDFSVLKEIVKKPIVDRLDHSLVISKNQEFLKDSLSMQDEERLIVTDFQPTCENLVAYIAEQILGNLPEGVDLYSVRLHETPTSFAEWFAEDNQS